MLSSLPHSRPQRRSAKRDAAASKPARKPPSRSGRKPPSKPAAATKPRTRTKPKPKVGGTPRPSAATRRAREDHRTPPPREQPAERDVVTTALEAAGELARIGITVGTQLVREATRRLPRP